MPIKVGSWKRLVSYFSIVLISGGAIWEHSFGVSWWGWGAIIAGFVCQIFAGMEIRRTPVDLCLIPLLLLSLFSLVVTTMFAVTVVQVTRLLSSIALFYGLIFWARERYRILIVIKMLLVGSVALAIIAPFIVNWQQAKVGLVPAVVYESFPLLFSDAVHPNIMATLMLVLFPIAFAVFIMFGLKKNGPGISYL